MIPPALLAAADDPALKGAPLAVLVWLWGQLEPHGYRPMKTTTVAQALGMKRETAGESLGLLVRTGYLAEGTRARRGVRTYRLLYSRLRIAG